MKHIVSILVLVLAPVVFAAPMQTASAERVPQTSSDSARSSPSKATSHDRHVRKHRAGNHHHRPRMAAKSHNS
jgi:Ni/Co efflux regulator RcnB